jgi:transcriptional regulator with PAS, ATPase and Fis domain
MTERGQPGLSPTLPTGGAATLPNRTLLVVGEGHFGTYPLDDGQTLVIGRDPESDIALPHAKISRRHALLHCGRDDQPIIVEDLGSTNGLKVGGKKLPPSSRAPLDQGTTLQLGPYVAMVLAATSGPTAAAPPRAAIPIIDPTPDGVPEVAARVARGAVSVLICGETGTGKEILARTLHQLSGRGGQLVAINCASLSETLLESELFGHERGAFTGAGRAKPGLFEVASGGTVFLDEIGELPPSLQAKLLRVLETRSVYRVGGVTPVNLDVRFLAATHRSLPEEVAAGRFRRDLYFRVNGIIMALLPLRERKDAIPRLAAELLAAALPEGKPAMPISTRALAALMRHDWPGNVRELRTVMERAAVVAEGDEVRERDILLNEAVGEGEPTATSAPPTAPSAPAFASSTSVTTAPARSLAPAAAPPRPLAPSTVVASPPPMVPAADGGDSEEKSRILAALDACAGNQTRAARMLGISRATLVNKLAVHRIPRPRS